MPENNVVEGLMRGIPVSEGIAIGKVWILESPWDEVGELSLKNSKAEGEVKRYQEAFREVAQQLVECRDRVQREIGEEESKIFEAHLAILNDAFFQEDVPSAIHEKLKNAEFVLKQGVEDLSQSFEKMKNDYFRHRYDDIRDVAVRILRILLQSEDVKISSKEPVILISHNLAPSDTARIDKEHVSGFATELGGETSHASILARSMGIPAVVGIERLMKRAGNGDSIIIDGNSGIVYVNPPQRVIKGYQKRQQQFSTYWKRLSEDVANPSVTTDQVNVALQANVAMTADVSMAVKYQADGIGLFRTELPFLIAGRLLTEEEQFKLYQTVTQAMKGKTVTIRTLDLGGDKFLPFQDVEPDHNPFLGWRSIRIFLQEKDVFKTQLRAILRASHFGSVRIMYPMISSLAEIVHIEQVLNEAKASLRIEGTPFDENIQCGIMIEVPSAAIMADRFIKHVDFFSIGTNDLIQYTLAVDRNNEKVAQFYQPLNPAILSLIQFTIQSANRAGKPVSLCGEMAGNPIYTSMLLGFGLRQFSMSPLMLPEVKERVRAVSIGECEDLAQKVLEMTSTDEIENTLWNFNVRVNKNQTVPFMEKRSDLDSM